MAGRLRMIAPPSAVLVAFAFAYALLEGPVLYAEWRWGAVPQSRPSIALLKFAAVAYAVYRVAAFHPFYRPGYREWLARTPWTSALPLPVGPAHLVPEDALALGGFAALAATQPGGDPVRLLGLILLWWSAALALTHWPTGVPGHGYATAFLGGLAVHLHPDKWAYLAAALATYAVSDAGRRASLARFPWAEAWWRTSLAADAGTAGRMDPWNGPACGWPYDQLRPPAPYLFRFETRDVVLVSMLAGWWLFSLESLLSDPREGEGLAIVVTVLLSAGLIGGRFLLYRVGHSPPINLLGRLATRQWLIPGYDQIYVGPASALVAGVVSRKLLRAWDVSEGVACPVALGVVMLLVFIAPPGLTRWRLTGRHRLAFALVNQQNKTEFVRVG
jgi:hypothetical protein